jgi:energy-coupling factor transport system ATP-binding protein
MVMQDVKHQLFADSVEDECELAAPGVSKERIDQLLRKFDLLPYKKVHPAVLSGGQRQRLAVCQAVLSGKKVMIFDEPTSGLDYTHMVQTGEIIRKLSCDGYIVLVITHDYEFLNMTCHSVLPLDGQDPVRARRDTK